MRIGGVAELLGMNFENELITRFKSEIEYARRESTMQFLFAQGVASARVRYRDGTAEELAGQRGVPGFRFVYDVGE